MERPEAAAPTRLASAPASLVVSMPNEMCKPQARRELEDMLVSGLANLDTASASGSRALPRRTSAEPLPGTIGQPLVRSSTAGAAAPLIRAETPRISVAMQYGEVAPSTPRLGLKPPWSADDKALAGCRAIDNIDNEDGSGLVAARPTKPKIAGMWGARRRRLLDIDAMVAARSNSNSRAPSEASRPHSEGNGRRRNLVKPQLCRPRPAGRLMPHLEHKELLRLNDFTTSTATYRTYGPQWVLTQRPGRGGTLGGLLRAEVERDRAEIAQREEQFQQSLSRPSAPPN